MLDSEFTRTDKKVNIQDAVGYKYYVKLNSIIKGSIPQIFNPTNPYVIHNIKLWCKLYNKTFSLVSNQYINCSTKLNWFCFKCNDIFMARWLHIYQGQNCSVCEGRQVTLKNCIATTHSDLVLDWHPTKNGSLTPYSVTKGSMKRAWWLCNKCGNEWESFIFHRCEGMGCPKCSESKGEKAITNILNKYQIYYIPQIEFEGLIGIGGGNLSYDFYLPDYNLLIEYQGEFHDGKSGGYTLKNLKRQKEHDNRKYQYAKLNEYNLLEIWYWEFDKIEEILLNKTNIIKKEGKLNW